MIYAIAFAFLLAWLLGVIGIYSLGWYIYLFLAASVILFGVRLFQTV